MTAEGLSAAIWLVAVALLVLVVARKRSRGRRPGVGSAAVGAVYGFLNEEKRHAVELIVEQRAEARDPEDKDGNLPDLEAPR
jgi:hypothetical protein